MRQCSGETSRPPAVSSTFPPTLRWVLLLRSPLHAPATWAVVTALLPHLPLKDTMNIVKSALTLIPVVALTGVVVVGIAVSVSLASWELL